MLFGIDHAQETRSVDHLIAELLTLARKHFGMDVAFVSEFKDGQRVFRFVDAQEGDDLIQVNGSDPLEESYCQRIVDGRLPELLQDATRNPVAITLPATLAVPIGAHLSVPIQFSTGRVYGTFCCFSRSPDLSLGNRDVATMRFFAEIVAKVLENQQSQHAARQAMVDRFQEMLDKRQYSTVFQPICDISENRVMGFEALSRFQSDPYRPPNEWFDDATQVGLLKELENTMRRDALEQLKALPPDTYLSLNVTPFAVLDPDFADSLSAYPLDRLVLEITEHDCVEDYELIAQALAPLRQKGIRLAVDDAGAGYASFRHILKLKPDIIKLDRSLIQHIDSSSDQRTLATALVQFSRAVGSQTLAEGVETQEELSVLRDLGVKLAQGYLLGRPQALH
jgi:EAL domain-containing protein (putative c-di-GMP-specific phosphodiesterase class I)